MTSRASGGLSSATDRRTAIRSRESDRPRFQDDWGTPPPEGLAWHLRAVSAARTPFSLAFLRLQENTAWRAPALLWHLDRLMAAEKDNPNYVANRGYVYASMGQWDKAIADTTRALDAMKPDDADRHALLSSRGNFHAELGQWKQAEEDIAQYVATQPELSRSTYGPQVELALLRLRRGDRPGYQKACAWLMAFRPPTAVRETPPSPFVIWPCVLVPEAVEDHEKILAGFRSRTSGRPGGIFPGRVPFSVEAAVLYRQGKYDEAERLLLPATRDRPANAVGNAGDYFFLAMAQYQLQRPEEARKSLAEGIQLMNQLVSDDDSFGPPLPVWQRRLAEQVLREEAERLLKGEKP